MTAHNSLTNRTHCSHGHDLRLPNALVTKGDGTMRCRVCRNASTQKTRYTVCKHCGKPQPPRFAAYCGDACRRAAVKRALRSRAQERREDDPDFAVAVLELCEQRERCATHWERQAIDERIARLRGLTFPPTNVGRHPVTTGHPLPPARIAPEGRDGWAGHS